jgi:hypothetical protein
MDQTVKVFLRWEDRVAKLEKLGVLFEKAHG